MSKVDEKTREGLTAGVLEEVFRERGRQVEQWGGAANDDQNRAYDWVAYITKQMGAIVAGGDFRERMIKVAALAVAAVESCDRHRARRGPPGACQPCGGDGEVATGPHGFMACETCKGSGKVPTADAPRDE